MSAKPVRTKSAPPARSVHQEYEEAMAACEKLQPGFDTAMKRFRAADIAKAAAENVETLKDRVMRLIYCVKDVATRHALEVLVEAIEAVTPPSRTSPLEKRGARKV